MYDERHEAKALDRLAADAGIEAGPNRDAALGLPLGPTNIDGEDVLGDPFDFDLVGATPPINPHDGTKPGPTTPSRTDAASLSTKPDKYGEVLAREFDAYVKLKGLLTDRAQHDALTAYSESIDASRDALNASLRGGAK